MIELRKKKNSMIKQEIEMENLPKDGRLIDSYINGRSG